MIVTSNVLYATSDAQLSYFSFYKSIYYTNVVFKLKILSKHGESCTTNLLDFYYNLQKSVFNNFKTWTNKY